jgi:hypothetical protein
MTQPTRVFAALAFAVVSGCSAGSGPSVPDPVSLDGPLTWYGVVGPLVTARCAICHTTGDIAPFSLENYEQVKVKLAAIRVEVAAKTMPPFPPEQSDESGCPKIDDVRQMSDAERQALLDWIDAGAPEGEARELPARKPNKPLGDPTDRWPMAEPYTSKKTSGDDYRCFVIKPTNLTALSVAAVSVEPGDRSIVHHAAIFLVPPDQIATADQLDAKDDGPGYDCFGGVGLESAYPAGVWVPGNDAPLVPPHGGVGYYLPPGWAWIIQNHYFLKGPAPADQSSVVLWRGDLVITEVPHALVMGSVDFELPPNSTTTIESMGKVTSSSETPALNQGWEGRIYGIWGHQHLLGRSIELDVLRADGSQQCVLRIPRWDFHWQSIYRLKEFFTLKAGDQLRLRCKFQNDRDTAVHFGEGTEDEMCFASLALLGP